MKLSIFRKWFAPRKPSRPGWSGRRTSRSRAFRPGVEALEDRTLPALITPFNVRFSANDTGDIVFVANTILTARPSSAPENSVRTAQQVSSAQNGAGSLLNNNNFIMSHVDVDGDATTFNSSRATLSLPAGSTVLFAGLYWGAESSSSARNQVRLDTPAAGGYVTINGAVVGADTTNDYHAFANVTPLVQAAGNGTYTVANVQANVNATDKHGGWSLVVVYRDPSAPARNLTVFDGYAVIQNNPASDRSADIPITGFITPPSGPVNAKVGVVAYEGDRGSAGASLRLNGTVLTDDQNPANNFFNSTISNQGVLVTSKDPNFVNQLGFDADIVRADGIIPNGATSATVSLTTGGETYFPGVVTTVIDLFAPTIQSTKNVTDLNGGPLEPGDILEYTVTVTNTGSDAAGNVILRDQIPANSSYVPGSLAILAGANAGAKTDAPGDDQANFSAAGNFVQFGLGIGASGAAGGTLAIGESSTIRFRVQVASNAPDGTAVTNQATVDFTGVTTGINLTGSSNPVTVNVAAQADLALTKVVNNPTPNVGAVVTFTVTLTNNGSQTATGVQVTDPLPSGLTFVSATPSQGTYTPATGLWDVGTVTTSAPLTLQIQAQVVSPGAQLNRAVISRSDQPDPNPGNNTAGAVVNATEADLVLAKSVSNPTPNVGDTITYTIQLSNSGPPTLSSRTSSRGTCLSSLPPSPRGASTRLPASGPCPRSRRRPWRS